MQSEHPAILFVTALAVQAVGASASLSTHLTTRLPPPCSTRHSVASAILSPSVTRMLKRQIGCPFSPVPSCRSI